MSFIGSKKERELGFLLFLSGCDFIEEGSGSRIKAKEQQLSFRDRRLGKKKKKKKQKLQSLEQVSQVTQCFPFFSLTANTKPSLSFSGI